MGRSMRWNVVYTGIIKNDSYPHPNTTTGLPITMNPNAPFVYAELMFAHDSITTPTLNALSSAFSQSRLDPSSFPRAIPLLPTKLPGCTFEAQISNRRAEIEVLSRLYIASAVSGKPIIPGGVTPASAFSDSEPAKLLLTQTIAEMRKDTRLLVSQVKQNQRLHPIEFKATSDRDYVLVKHFVPYFITPGAWHFSRATFRPMFVEQNEENLIDIFPGAVQILPIRMQLVDARNIINLEYDASIGDLFNRVHSDAATQTVELGYVNTIIANMRMATPGSPGHAQLQLACHFAAIHIVSYATGGGVCPSLFANIRDIMELTTDGLTYSERIASTMVGFISGDAADEAVNKPAEFVVARTAYPSGPIPDPVTQLASVARDCAQRIKAVSPRVLTNEDMISMRVSIAQDIPLIVEMKAAERANALIISDAANVVKDFMTTLITAATDGDIIDGEPPLAGCIFARGKASKKSSMQAHASVREFAAADAAIQTIRSVAGMMLPDLDSQSDHVYIHKDAAPEFDDVMRITESKDISRGIVESRMKTRMHINRARDAIDTLRKITKRNYTLGADKLTTSKLISQRNRRAIHENMITYINKRKKGATGAYSISHAGTEYEKAVSGSLHSFHRVCGMLITFAKSLVDLNTDNVDNMFTWILSQCTLINDELAKQFKAPDNVSKQIQDLLSAAIPDIEGHMTELSAHVREIMKERNLPRPMPDEKDRGVAELLKTDTAAEIDSLLMMHNVAFKSARNRLIAALCNTVISDADVDDDDDEKRPEAKIHENDSGSDSDSDSDDEHPDGDDLSDFRNRISTDGSTDDLIGEDGLTPRVFAFTTQTLERMRFFDTLAHSLDHSLAVIGRVGDTAHTDRLLSIRANGPWSPVYMERVGAYLRECHSEYIMGALQCAIRMSNTPEYRVSDKTLESLWSCITAATSVGSAINGLMFPTAVYACLAKETQNVTQRNLAQRTLPWSPPINPDIANITSEVDDAEAALCSFDTILDQMTSIPYDVRRGRWWKDGNDGGIGEKFELLNSHYSTMFDSCIRDLRERTMNRVNPRGEQRQIRGVQVSPPAPPRPVVARSVADRASIGVGPMSGGSADIDPAVYEETDDEFDDFDKVVNVSLDSLKDMAITATKARAAHDIKRELALFDSEMSNEDYQRRSLALWRGRTEAISESRGDRPSGSRVARWRARITRFTTDRAVINRFIAQYSEMRITKLAQGGVNPSQRVRIQILRSALRVIDDEMARTVGSKKDEYRRASTGLKMKSGGSLFEAGLKIQLLDRKIDADNQRSRRRAADEMVRLTATLDNKRDMEQRRMISTTQHQIQLLERKIASQTDRDDAKYAHELDILTRKLLHEEDKNDDETYKEIYVLERKIDAEARRSTNRNAAELARISAKIAGDARKAKFDRRQRRAAADADRAQGLAIAQAQYYERVYIRRNESLEATRRQLQTLREKIEADRLHSVAKCELEIDRLRAKVYIEANLSRVRTSDLHDKLTADVQLAIRNNNASMDRLNASLTNARLIAQSRLYANVAQERARTAVNLGKYIADISLRQRSAALARETAIQSAIENVFKSQVMAAKTVGDQMNGVSRSAREFAKVVNDQFKLNMDNIAASQQEHIRRLEAEIKTATDTLTRKRQDIVDMNNMAIEHTRLNDQRNRDRARMDIDGFRARADLDMKQVDQLIRVGESAQRGALADRAGKNGVIADLSRTSVAAGNIEARSAVEAARLNLQGTIAAQRGEIAAGGNAMRLLSLQAKSSEKQVAPGAMFGPGGVSGLTSRHFGIVSPAIDTIIEFIKLVSGFSGIQFTMLFDESHMREGRFSQMVRRNAGLSTTSTDRIRAAGEEGKASVTTAARAITDIRMGLEARFDSLLASFGDLPSIDTAEIARIRGRVVRRSEVLSNNLNQYNQRARSEEKFSNESYAAVVSGFATVETVFETAFATAEANHRRDIDNAGESLLNFIQDTSQDPAVLTRMRDAAFQSAHEVGEIAKASFRENGMFRQIESARARLANTIPAAVADGNNPASRLIEVFDETRRAMDPAGGDVNMHQANPMTPRDHLDFALSNSDMYSIIPGHQIIQDARNDPSSLLELFSSFATRHREIMSHVEQATKKLAHGANPDGSEDSLERTLREVARRNGDLSGMEITGPLNHDEIPEWVHSLATYAGFDKYHSYMMAPRLAAQIAKVVVFLRASGSHMSQIGRVPLYEILRSPLMRTTLAEFIGVELIRLGGQTYNMTSKHSLADMNRTLAGISNFLQRVRVRTLRWHPSDQIPNEDDYEDPFFLAPAQPV